MCVCVAIANVGLGLRIGNDDSCGRVKQVANINTTLLLTEEGISNLLVTAAPIGMRCAELNSVLQQTSSRT